VVQKYTTSNPPWQSTLSGIGSHTGRTVGQLASWNGVAGPSYIIHPNQKIYVDPPGTYNGTKKIG
jgi:LysM repeat protein